MIGAQQLDDINCSSKPSVLPQRKPKPRPRPSLQHQLSHIGSTIHDSEANLRRSGKKSSSSTGRRALPPRPQRKPNYCRGIWFLYTRHEANIEKQILPVLTTQYSEWSCIMGFWSMLHILNLFKTLIKNPWVEDNCYWYNYSSSVYYYRECSCRVVRSWVWLSRQNIWCGVLWGG